LAGHLVLLVLLLVTLWLLVAVERLELAVVVLAGAAAAGLVVF
jgi:hypothetical protein